MNRDQRINIWLAIVSILLSAIIPFLIIGTVRILKNDFKVEVMWNAGYVDQNKIQEIIALINAQNETLRTLIIVNKEDIVDIKADLKVINIELIKVSRTTRSALKSEREMDTTRLNNILKKWKPLDTAMLNSGSGLNCEY